MARTARKRRKIILGQPGYPRKPIEIKKVFLCRSEQAARSTSTANGEQQAKFFHCEKQQTASSQLPGQSDLRNAEILERVGWRVVGSVVEGVLFWSDFNWNIYFVPGRRVWVNHHQGTLNQHSWIDSWTDQISLHKLAYLIPPRYYQMGPRFGLWNKEHGVHAVRQLD